MHAIFSRTSLDLFDVAAQMGKLNIYKEHIIGVIHCVRFSGASLSWLWKGKKPLSNLMIG